MLHCVRQEIGIASELIMESLNVESQEQCVNCFIEYVKKYMYGFM